MSRLRPFKHSGTHNRLSNESLGEWTKISFMVTMFKNNIEGKTLGLPSKFISEYRDELSETVKLFDLDHNVWQVKLTKGKNSFWFDGDWDEFVRYHSITEGYALVFKYRGNYKSISTFSVSIFDRSACEIQYSLNEPSNCTNYGKNSSKPDKPISSRKHMMETNTSMRNRASPSTDSSLHGRKKRRRDHSSVLKENSSSEREPERQKNSLKVNIKEEAALTDIEEDANDDIDLALEGIITSQNFFKQYEQATLNTRKAVLKACASKPRNVCFMVLLQMYNTISSGHLLPPAAFTREYLHDQCKFIEFHLSNGKKYTVGVHRDSSRLESVRFKVGWPKFSGANNLKFGDVCLFELDPSAAEIVLKVSIFRASDF